MRVADGTQAAPARAQPTARQSRASLPQEHVVARLRQSGRRLVVPSVLFVVLCFGTGYWWHRLSPAWLNTALPAVAGALALLLCVAPLLRWRNRVVLVTDRRLIVLRGFVIRRRTEFLLAPGAEATLKRGPLQLVAGSGDVIVRAGAEGTMVLHDVPSARLVHAAILEVAGRLR